MTQVLFLGSSPINMARTRLDAEVREIGVQLAKAKYRDLFNVNQQFAVRTNDLLGIFQNNPSEIVHFGGHCDQDGLQFEDANGMAQAIPADRIVQVFKLPYIQSHTKCVILNGCSTEPLAKALSAVIDVAIGTRRPINNRTAQSFAGGFYQALANGYSVSVALATAAAEAGLQGHDGEAYVAHYRSDAAQDLHFRHASGNPGKSGGNPHWRQVLSRECGRPELREALRALVPTDEDFDQLLVDHFPAIQFRMSGGMDRVRKENLLLQLVDLGELRAILLKKT